MHIFPYSVRPGTAAAKMEGQVDKAVKKARAKRAADVAGQMEKAFLESCVGKELEVLFEQEADGWSFGHAGNYCKVSVKGTDLHNHTSKVLMNAAKDGLLLGKILL